MVSMSNGHEFTVENEEENSRLVYKSQPNPRLVTLKQYWKIVCQTHFDRVRNAIIDEKMLL
ncbi:hypothetical protein BpHYR1_034330 [Brachionus plicatilis]|uniref:Uncharacterized protein n=1 Tax=Brachionus plicatilis TaxID=10195 RepID=A0A3M7RLQ1_BRAPC|nr:hypothetical protein BpHYR1_034330 [Brachionus plicatilis]